MKEKVKINGKKNGLIFGLPARESARWCEQFARRRGAAKVVACADRARARATKNFQSWKF